MTILVVTAVEAERDAVVRDLAPASAGRLHVVVGGIGPVASAVSTSAALAALQNVSLVICAGIAGGFRDRIAVGDVAVADRVTFADLGARTDDGFLTLDAMGLQQDSSYAISNSWIDDELRRHVAVVSGEILTLACMTGMDDDAKRLADCHPHAVAEAMEGFGVAAAAGQAGLPFVELRAISNVAGKRDRSTWNMPRALDALSQAFAALQKEKESWE